VNRENPAQSLRSARLAAGLSQRALATLAGIPQPNIAAYESGRRTPSAATLERLSTALAAPTLERVREQRAAILGFAVRRGLADIRVFGSVARGTAGRDSDVDLLVHPTRDASVFDLAGFGEEVAELLGVGVDVVSDRGRGPTMDRIRTEAVPL